MGLLRGLLLAPPLLWAPKEGMVRPPKEGGASSSGGRRRMRWPPEEEERRMGKRSRRRGGGRMGHPHSRSLGASS